MNPYLGIDLSIRIPEDSEIIEGQEAKKYANRTDDRKLTTKLVALDILEKVPLYCTQGNILEVCCGSGDLTQTLYDLTKNQNITGTDGSHILIEEAKSRYPNRLFEVKDVHTPSSDKYDLVICKDAFHHFKDSKQGLIDLLNHVSHGGYLYIFDLNRRAYYGEVCKREQAITDTHAKRRFLHSVNASLTATEFCEILSNPIVMMQTETASIYYPFSFSDNSLSKSKDLIEKDISKEHKLRSLFAVYLIRRKR